MQWNLSITRKTYYALGVLGTALSMGQAIMLLFGTSMNLLENIAFVLTGLMLLFLAAIKGSDGRDKARYFLCFVLLLFGSGMVLGLPWVDRVAAGLSWPIFLWYEEMRQGGLSRQAWAVTGTEVASFLLWLLVVPGQMAALMPAANVVWLAVVLMRAWAILSLYRQESARQMESGEERKEKSK